jgi:hypothetical protein
MLPAQVKGSRDDTMKMRWLVMLGALGSASVSGALLAGCSGASCENLCEDVKSCPGEDKTVDCSVSCKKTETLNNISKCAERYDEFLRCAAGADDLCATDQDTCKAEVKDYVTCVLDYCAIEENAVKDECKS